MRTAFTIVALLIALAAFVYAFIQQTAAVKARDLAVKNESLARENAALCLRQANKVDSLQKLLDSCRAQK